MAKMNITIESIFGGQAPAKYFPQKGQYTVAIGIDPDMPIDDTAKGVSGAIRPTAMAKFSGTEITGVPLWFITNPKTENTYLYANDGKVHTIDNTMAMGTALNSGSALSSASGNGAAYYDNYAYFVKQTDVARYGPLDGSPSLTQDYWTNTLSKTALTNTTYPTINGISIPNHPMLRHTDNKLYFADVVSNQGVLHFIATNKTSAEGDTNNGSTYNALDFPYGLWPTVLESYGTDIAVALIEGTSDEVKQTRAKLAFWDTTSSSYSQIIDLEFSDPFITALKNKNGILYVFSGGAGLGCRVSRYIGGSSFQEIAYLEDTYPPFQGAVDHILNRIAWGGSTTYPEVTASVYAYGNKEEKVPGGLYNILKATSVGSNPLVTALKYVQSSAFTKPQPLIGWTDGSAKGLDKLSTTYGVSLIRLPLFRVGQNFEVKSIKIPLGAAVAANITITPKILVDDESTTYSAGSNGLRVINNTNYPNSERWLEMVLDGVRGVNDFILEFRWSGTVLCPIKMPITIEVETYERRN